MSISNRVWLSVRPHVVVNDPAPRQVLARVYFKDSENWQREYLEDATQTALSWLGDRYLLAKPINRKEHSCRAT